MRKPIMNNNLEKIIPEMKEIKNYSLVRKILDVWEEAITSGGWKEEDLCRIPFASTIKDCKISLLDHIRSVTRICIMAEKALKEIYGKQIDINRDYLIAGALLHDIGKLLELEEEDGVFKKSKSGSLLRHPFSGVALCYKHGIPEEILHAIAVHSREGEGFPKTIEAKIIHHADFMNYEIFLA
jgi:putative nucleotidyltransferase with HDIG domain